MGREQQQKGGFESYSRGTTGTSTRPEPSAPPLVSDGYQSSTPQPSAPPLVFDGYQSSAQQPSAPPPENPFALSGGYQQSAPPLDNPSELLSSEISTCFQQANGGLASLISAAEFDTSYDNWLYKQDTHQRFAAIICYLAYLLEKEDVEELKKVFQGLNNNQFPPEAEQFLSLDFLSTEQYFNHIQDNFIENPDIEYGKANDVGIRKGVLEAQISNFLTSKNRTENLAQIMVRAFKYYRDSSNPAYGIKHFKCIARNFKTIGSALNDLKNVVATLGKNLQTSRYSFFLNRGGWGDKNDKLKILLYHIRLFNENTPYSTITEHFKELVQLFLVVRGWGPFKSKDGRTSSGRALLELLNEPENETLRAIIIDSPQCKDVPETLQYEHLVAYAKGEAVGATAQKEWRNELSSENFVKKAYKL